MLSQWREIVQQLMSGPILMEPQALHRFVGELQLWQAGGSPYDPEQPRLQGLEDFFDEDGNQQDVRGVRLLSVKGVILPDAPRWMRGWATSAESIRRQANAAADDDAVKRVFMYVDSPGGVFNSVPEAARAIRSLADRKPVSVFGRNFVTSAAYYLASAGTPGRLTIQASTSVGSVGIYVAIPRADDFELKVYRIGENKAVGMPFEQLQQKQETELYRQLQESLDMFVADVSEFRGIAESDVRGERFGDSTTFVGPEALKRGIVDRLGTIEDVLSQEMAELTDDSTSDRRFIGERKMKVTARICSALFAQGWTTKLDAPDEECVQALRVGANVAGVDVESMSEQEVINFVSGRQEQATLEVAVQPVAQQPVTPEPAVAVPTAPAQSSESSSPAPSRPAESNRTERIVAVGQLMGVDSDAVAEAVAGNQTIEEIRSGWVERQAERNEPVAHHVVAVDSEQDKVRSAATCALAIYAGRPDTVTQEERQNAQSFLRSTTPQIIRRTLRNVLDGPMVDQMTDDEAASYMLQSGVARCQIDSGSVPAPIRHERGAELVHNGHDPMAQLPSSAQWVMGPATRVVDHADLLSDLMNKLMYARADEQSITYTQWARGLAPAPTLHSTSVVDVGTVDILSLEADGNPHADIAVHSEMPTYVNPGIYSGKVGLTIRMLAMGDLSAFASLAADLATAVEFTVDQGCRSLLAQNPNLLDNFALFSSSRTDSTGAVMSNISASAGAPSITTATAHEKQHMLMRNKFTVKRSNMLMQAVLVPPNQKHAAEQMFNPMEVAAGEVAGKQTDATVNVFRNRVRVIPDANLHDFDANAWYSFSDQRISPVAYRFVQGFGDSAGLLSQWVDPDTGTRYVGRRAAFGVGPWNPRGAVKNAGA